VSYNTVRLETAEETFGKDLGLVHEAVVTGRRAGGTRAFWSTLAHNPQFFEAATQFHQKCFPGGYYGTTIDRAVEIMGYERVVRPELACEVLHRKISKDAGPLSEPHPLRPLTHVPFLPHTLEGCAMQNREGLHSWYLLCMLPMTLGQVDEVQSKHYWNTWALAHGGSVLVEEKNRNTYFKKKVGGHSPGYPEYVLLDFASPLDSRSMKSKWTRKPVEELRDAIKQYSNGTMHAAGFGTLAQADMLIQVAHKVKAMDGWVHWQGYAGREYNETFAMHSGFPVMGEKTTLTYDDVPTDPRMSVCLELRQYRDAMQELGI